MGFRRIASGIHYYGLLHVLIKDFIHISDRKGKEQHTFKDKKDYTRLCIICNHIKNAASSVHGSLSLLKK